MSVIAEVAACLELVIRLASASSQLVAASESLSRSLNLEKNSMDDSLTLSSDSTALVFRRLKALESYGDVLGRSSALRAHVLDVQEKLLEQVRLSACIQGEVEALASRLAMEPKAKAGFFSLLADAAAGGRRKKAVGQILEDYRSQMKQLSDNSSRVAKSMDAVDKLHSEIMASDTFKSGLVFKDFKALRNMWIVNDFKDGATCERLVDAIMVEVRDFDAETAKYFLEEEVVKGAKITNDDGSKYIGKQKVCVLGANFVDFFRKKEDFVAANEEDAILAEPLLSDFAAWLAAQGEALQKKNKVWKDSGRHKYSICGGLDTSARHRSNAVMMSQLGAELSAVTVKQEERNRKIADKAAKRISMTQESLGESQMIALAQSIGGEEEHSHFRSNLLEKMKLEELKAMCVGKGIKVLGKGWSTCCPPTGCKADIIKSLCTR